MTHELYKKYRPTTFKGVIGQAETVKILAAKTKAGTLPHAMIFHGPSGCSKTTLARIVAGKLGCDMGLHFKEINAANHNGVAHVRKIDEHMRLAARCRVWLIDECHLLTDEAQSALLKMTEDTPAHVYFIFCTTHLQKMKDALVNRLDKFSIQALSPRDMRTVIMNVVTAERAAVPTKVIDRIIDVADGSPRRALVLLEQTLALDEAEAIQFLQSNDLRQAAVEICLALMRPQTTWSDMAAIIKGVKEEPESLRHLVLAWSTTAMLNQPKPGRAFYIIQAFRDSWFSCGRAGLLASCYEVINAGK